MKTVMSTMKMPMAAVALVGLWAGTAAADGPAPPPGLTLRARVASAVAYGKDRGAWQQSLVVGAIWGDQTGVYYAAYDDDPQYLPTNDWAFRIGSITKTMTATLLALQNGQGMRVGACGLATAPTMLRDKLEEACPGCDPLPWPRNDITISQLATHSSGLPKRATVPVCNPQELYESLTRCDYDPSGGGPGCAGGHLPPTDCTTPCACHQPADQYLYSNWAFSTLGHLLAHNAHYSSWRELDRAKVLDPLGMIHTKVNGESFAGLYKAPTTSCTPSGCTNVTEAPYAAVSSPAGGLWSTGPDMMRYLRFAMGLPHDAPGPGVDALYGVRDLIFCRRAAGDENYDRSPGWMGLGWNQNYLGPAQSGAPPAVNPNDLIWWKDGDYSTHHAYIAFLPSKNAGVFVLSNTDHPDGMGPHAIAKHILRSF